LMLDLIKELVDLSALKDPTKDQSRSRIDVMKQLRSKGFKHHDIWVLAGRKGSESSVRRQIGGVDVMDETEHDQLLTTLADFAVNGYTLEDIEAVKKNELKAEDIRRNIDLNADLEQRGLFPELQEEMLEAAQKFGDPKEVLKALNQFEGMNAIVTEIKQLEQLRGRIQNEIKDGEAKLENQRLETQRHQTHMTIVKQLVEDHSFDYDSLDKLLSLAKKHGDPLQVIGAVNDYGEIGNIKKEIATRNKELDVVEGKIRVADAEYSKLTKLNAEANQMLGEIKANEKQSMRLQTISNLLQRPRETRSTPDELARITVALLNNVAECAKANPGQDNSFMRIVKGDVEVTIISLQNYLRGR
jgi:hypothetical protein